MPPADLTRLELGDLIALPDGRELTVRAVERRLHTQVGPMAGWLLGGEVGPGAVLVSLPGQPGQEVDLYSPLVDVPATARNARTVVEGAVSYYAPHLPTVSGAMGELGYKVCAMRGSGEPMVLVWRGGEMVVFVRTGSVNPQALRFALLARDPSVTEQDVTRYSARVVAPNQVNGPGQAAPATVPVRERRRFAVPGRR